jgi:outer membrane lipoprotein LolB
VNALSRHPARPAVLAVGALVVALAGALTGCASLVEPSASATDALAGRLSVRLESSSGKPAKSLSAAFRLEGNAERGSLDLSTPFGTMLAQARWSAGQALLVTPQGQTHYDDLPALTRDMLGEALPLPALFDWLRGRPWPGAESRAAVPPEEAGFLQLGWQVTLVRFEQGFIDAQRVEAPLVTVRARLDRP